MKASKNQNERGRRYFCFIVASFWPPLPCACTEQSRIFRKLKQHNQRQNTAIYYSNHTPSYISLRTTHYNETSIHFNIIKFRKCSVPPHTANNQKFWSFGVSSSSCMTTKLQKDFKAYFEKRLSKESDCATHRYSLWPQKFVQLMSIDTKCIW